MTRAWQLTRAATGSESAELDRGGGTGRAGADSRNGRSWTGEPQYGRGGQAGGAEMQIHSTEGEAKHAELRWGVTAWRGRQSRRSWDGESEQAELAAGRAAPRRLGGPGDQVPADRGQERRRAGRPLRAPPGPLPCAGEEQ